MGNFVCGQMRPLALLVSMRDLLYFTRYKLVDNLLLLFMAVSAIIKCTEHLRDEVKLGG